MNPIEIIKTHKYAIGSSIVFLVAIYIYYKMRSETTSEKSDITPVVVTPESIPSHDLKDLQKLIRVFTHEMKKSSQSLIQFNTDTMKTRNYLNIRNNLFTKDIITTKLLIDSKSLDHTQEFDPSNFLVILGGDSYPISYKNVIGFRLVKCSIPIKPFDVVPDDDILFYTGGQVQLSVGSYTGQSLALELTNKQQGQFNTFNAIYNNITRKFTLQVTDPAHIFTIEWAKSPLLAKIFGFYETNTTVPAAPPFLSSSFVGDFTTSFVDLVIPEIPLIACKDNSKGKPIIERIPLIQRATDNSRSYYESNTSDYFTQNYFFPIKLSQLTIQLYLDSQADVIYDSQRGETEFEFELTILKNTALMNK